MDVDRSRFGRRLVSPHAFKQAIARLHPVAVVDQVAEEIEFSAISGITDAGVAALAAAPALRRLSVDGSPKVTPAVLGRFPAGIKVRVTGG